MAVSILALVIATGGTSPTAAGLIGSADIRNKAIKSVDVKDQNLKGRDVKNGSLGAMDIRDNSLKTADFAKGQLPAGAQGPAGPAGVGCWAPVDATGAIVAQSGGFAVTAAYPMLTPAGTDTAGLRANGNVYINAGENLTDNGILTVVVLQNTIDQNGDAITKGRAPAADSNPEFAGEISAAMCQPGVVNCAPPPPATPTTSSSARATATALSPRPTRERFYVVVTGDSSDRPDRRGSVLVVLVPDVEGRGLVGGEFSGFLDAEPFDRRHDVEVDAVDLDAAIQWRDRVGEPVGARVDHRSRARPSPRARMTGRAAVKEMAQVAGTTRPVTSPSAIRPPDVPGAV